MNRIPDELLSKLSTGTGPVPLPTYDSTPDPQLATLKEIDLREHLAKHEGLVFNSRGACLCPVHQENDPSFEVKRHSDGHWYWFDWHNQGQAGFSGTIIDYYVTIKALTVAEAIQAIKERENIEDAPTAARESGTVPDPRPETDLERPFEGTLGQFLLAAIPEPTPLVYDLINENEFLLLGGVKGSHKTTFMMNMGLAFSSGVEFLGFKAARTGRFLMIQQELNEGEFQRRLRAAVFGRQFDIDNFIPYTSTVDPIKLLTKEGWERLVELIEKFKPDWIGLDPLSKFHRANESDPRTWAEVRDRIHLIVKNYCSVALSQHFTSKRPKDDPEAPAEAAGWFRGSTVLSDSADVLFCLHRLPGQKDNPRLRLPYENYNMVEIELRNGKWPSRFATEFEESSFLVSRSDVWQELGAKIDLGNVREVIEAHDGQLLFADLVKHYQTQFGQAGKDGVSITTIKKALDRDVAAGYITIERLPGRGKPLLIKSR